MHITAAATASSLMSTMNLFGRILPYSSVSPNTLVSNSLYESEVSELQTLVLFADSRRESFNVADFRGLNRILVLIL